MSQPLRIALLGTRGIPGRYGGFETFAEELSIRLKARGHEVTVYQRHCFGKAPGDTSPYNGVLRRSTATLMHKYAETPLSALTSLADAAFRNFDCGILCNAANSPFAWIASLAGLPLAINVDGIERNRSKWNSFGKLWYRLGEWSSVRFATKVVADAEVIAKYYREKFKISPEVIGYGATAQVPSGTTTLEKYGLRKGEYLLYVSRFEPENNALLVVQAYRKSGLSLPLVMVGDAPYAHEYKQSVYNAAQNDPRIIFTGFQFGEAYRELRAHCQIYIQATEVGGTHPALVEAMAYGNSIIANDVPEHREVLANAGLFYEFNNESSAAGILTKLAADANLRATLATLARARAAQTYSWDVVTDQYERLCNQITKH